MPVSGSGILMRHAAAHQRTPPFPHFRETAFGNHSQLVQRDQPREGNLFEFLNKSRGIGNPQEMAA